MSNWLLPFLISTKFSIISFTWIKLSFTFLALLLSTKCAAFRIIFCRAYHFLSNQFVPEKNLLLKIKWKKFSFANKLNCKWKLEIKLLKNAICKNKYFNFLSIIATNLDKLFAWFKRSFGTISWNLLYLKVHTLFLYGSLF